MWILIWLAVWTTDHGATSANVLQEWQFTDTDKREAYVACRNAKEALETATVIPAYERPTKYMYLCQYRGK